MKKKYEKAELANFIKQKAYGPGRSIDVSRACDMHYWLEAKRGRKNPGYKITASKEPSEKFPL